MFNYMGLINSASSASAWRGYVYYKENKVRSINKINEIQVGIKSIGNDTNQNLSNLSKS